MSADKYIETLRQIRSLVDEALREAKSVSRAKKHVKPQESREEIPPSQFTFDVNILAFMNKYAKGLKGPQKFTLLLARMAKGSVTTAVSYQDIKSQWNKMRTVLGGSL